MHHTLLFGILIIIINQVVILSNALETRTIFAFGPQPTYSSGTPKKNIRVGEFFMIPPTDPPGMSVTSTPALTPWNVGGAIVPRIFEDSYYYYDYLSDSIKRFVIPTGVTNTFITDIGCSDNKPCPAIYDFSISYNTTKEQAVFFFISSHPSIVGPNTTLVLLSIPMQYIPSNGISLLHLYGLPTLSVVIRYSPLETIRAMVPNTKIINGNQTTYALILISSSTPTNNNTSTRFRVRWTEPVDAFTFPSKFYVGFNMQIPFQSQMIVSKYVSRIGAIFWMAPISGNQWQICVFNPQSVSSLKNTSIILDNNSTALYYSNPFNLTGLTYGMYGTFVWGFYEDPIYPNIFYIYSIEYGRKVLYQITLNDTFFGGVYSASTLNTLPIEYALFTVPIQRVDVVADYSNILALFYTFNGDISISSQKMSITNNGNSSTSNTPSPPFTLPPNNNNAGSGHTPLTIVFYWISLCHITYILSALFCL